MRDERFGSYSIVDTLAGMSRLSRLKSISAVRPLVTAAAPPRRQLAGVVAAARLVQRLGQRLVGLARRDVVEGLHRLETAARRRRLVCANGHHYTTLGVTSYQ